VAEVKFLIVNNAVEINRICWWWE